MSDGQRAADHEDSLNSTEMEARNSTMDPISGLKGDRVWLFTGMMPQEVVDQLRWYYGHCCKNRRDHRMWRNAWCPGALPVVVSRFFATEPFDQKLRAAVLSSTSVKLVGGLSAKDAGIFAKEMNCEPDFLQTIRKAKGYTQFACYVRNYTRRPIALTVPLGQMEKKEQLTSEELDQVLAENRRRYSATGERTGARVEEGETLLRPDLL